MENHLPFNFFIVAFPFEGISVNWLVNLIYQFCFAAIAASFLFFYYSVVLLLMNHSCWGLDSLIIHIEKLQSIDVEDNKHSVSREIQERVKIIATYKVIEWQNQAQDLLKFNFLLDFSLLSSIYCCCLYCLAADPFASLFPYMVVAILLSQLFILCLMGHRVIVRIEKLQAFVYGVKWYSMTAAMRREIQLILIMAQNLKGFNGIFNEVNMETFQSV